MSFRSNSITSSTAQSFGSFNIMDVPMYDNGQVSSSPKKLRSVPVQKPTVQTPPQIRGLRAKYGNVHSTDVPAPLRVTRRTGTSFKPQQRPPPPNVAAYLNKPLPKLPPSGPRSAASAAKPTGISKSYNSASGNVKRPVPASTTGGNGVFTSTGQRIDGPSEISAFSATTASTARTRTQKARERNLNRYGDEILAAAQRGRTTKAPEPWLNSRRAPTSFPHRDAGQGNKVGRSSSRSSRSSRTGITDAIDKFKQNQIQQREEAASRKRLEAAKAVVRNGLGLHRRVQESREWMALTIQERELLKKEMEEDSVRRYYGRPSADEERGDKAKGKKDKSCAVM